MSSSGMSKMKSNLALYGYAASSYFSDNLLANFLFPYAVVLNVSFDQMGVIRSVRNLFQNILQIGWGEISERFSKRILIAISYLSSGCLIAAFLLFHNPLQFLVLVILQSIIWSAATPAWNSLLADYTSIRTRGKILGKIGAVSRLSGVIATLMVALITSSQPEGLTASSFTLPFMLSAAAAIMGAILILFVNEIKVKGSSYSSGILSPLLNRDFRFFLTVSGLHWFTMALAWPLFPYVTVNVVHAAIWQIAVISAVSDLITSIFQPKMGSAMDRFGRKPFLFISRFSLFLFPLLYAFATNWLQLLTINALLAISTSALTISLSAYIMDSAPSGLRANYVASTNMVMGIATFLGSLVGGVFTSYLSDLIGEKQALFIGLITSSLLRLIASLGFLFIKETLPKDRDIHDSSNLS